MAEVRRFVDGTFEMCLSESEMDLVRACLLEAWGGLKDYDFLARTGFERAVAIELRDLLRDETRRARSEAEDSEGGPESDG